jgi:hypothetical protein
MGIPPSPAKIGNPHVPDALQAAWPAICLIDAKPKREGVADRRDVEGPIKGLIS